MKPASGVMARLKTAAFAARHDNPRVRPAMTAPPTITSATYFAASTAYAAGETVYTSPNFYTVTTAGTTASGGTLSGTGTGIVSGTAAFAFLTTFPTALHSNPPSAGGNYYGWCNGADPRKGVFGLYGGVVASDPVSHYAHSLAATVAGTRSSYTPRARFVADSARFVIRYLDVAAGHGRYRLIVDGRYASRTPVVPARSGFGFLIVDFTKAGGRASRDITLEYSGVFGGVDTLATEGIYAPAPALLKAAVTGDSFSASGGVFNGADVYPCVLADLLGIANFNDAGIGGAGLLVPGPSGTAISRVSDICSFAPDVVFEANGHNDLGFAPAQVQAAELALLRAIRMCVPDAAIFVHGIPPGPHMPIHGAEWATFDAARAAAVAAMNDPLVFFIPTQTDPNGPWVYGSGCEGRPAGDGNSDIYSAADAIHFNEAGHFFWASRMADATLRILAAY